MPQDHSNTAKLEANTPSPPRTASHSGSIFGRERLRRSVLESDVREKEKELTKLQGWCEGLERALAKERSESHRLATDLQDTQTSLSQEREDCRRLNSELHEAQKRIDTLDALLEEDNDNAAAAHDTRSVSSGSTRDQQLQEKVQHTVVTKNKALEKNATLKDQLERMDDRVLSCQAERDQARQESSQLRAEVAAMKTEKKAMQRQIDKAAKEAQKAKEEQQKMAQELAAKDQQLQQLRARVVDEESRNMVLSRRIASLELITSETLKGQGNRWFHVGAWVQQMCSSSSAARYFGWIRRPWWRLHKQE